MTTPLKLLLIEDSEDDAQLLVRTLRRDDFDVTFERVDSLDGLRAALTQEQWDVIISDYRLPGFDGLAVLELYKSFNLDLPFIIVSGALGDEMAVQVMKAGAHDFLLKENLMRLAPAILRELAEAEVRKERNNALEELRRSEARYRAIVEDQTELIVRYSLDGVVSYVNNAFERLHEKRAENIIGKKRIEFIPEGERKTWDEQHATLSQDNPVITCEIAYTQIDSQVVWLQWRDRLIFDMEGNPLECQGVGRDITERKIAETELKSFAENLERRAIQVQVAAEVAREIAKARDLNVLLNRAVDLIRDRFGFYHAGVFLVDEEGKFAILKAASGEIGQQLVGSAHSLKIGKEGIVGYVAEIGEPLVVSDVNTDDVYYQQPLLPETRSEMALPLKIGEKVIGVLDVQSQNPNAFDDDDVRVLNTMADQLAIAFENVRLYNQARRRAQELEGLYDTALVTSSELDTDALLMRLYEQVKKLINPDTFIIALYESELDEINIVLAMEDDEEEQHFSGMRLSVSGGGLSGWVIKTRQPLLVGDVENDPLPVEPVRSPHEDPVTRAWLGVPLIVREKVVGVVSIQSFQPNVFDDSHRRFLESLAFQAGIALENSRLFTAEREAREQAETLREITRVVSGSLDLPNVLRSILEQLKRLLVFDTASVMLLDGSEGSAFVMGIGYSDPPRTGRSASDKLPDSPILANMEKNLEPVIISDVREHPDWIWVEGAEHVRSFMGVPIIVRNRMVGAFMVDSALLNHFTEHDAQTVQTISHHIAIAIETVRLFEAERSQLLLARTLQDVGMLLTSQIALDEVLEKIIDLLGRVVQYDSVNVQLFGDDQQLYLAAGRGLPDFDQDDKAYLGFSDQQIDALGLTNRKVVVIADTNTDPRWVATAQTNQIRSWIGAPLSVRGILIGFLTVDSRSPNTYNAEIAETVMAFANQAAIAIGNAQLFEAERLARENAEALREAAQAISSTLSLDEVIEAVLSQMSRVLAFDSGCVVLVEEGRSRVQAGFGYEKYADPELLSSIQFDEHVETIGYVVREGKPLMIPDVRQDPRWEKTPLNGHVCSWLGVPLKVRDQVLGLFSLDRDIRGGFSNDEISLAQMFATHTSAAIENARLYETAEQRAKELETLRQVGLSLTESLETQSVFWAVLNGVFQLISDVGDAHIFTYQNERLSFGSALWQDGTRDEPLAEPRPDGLTYTVARSGEVIAVPDMLKHPLFDKVTVKEGWSGAIIGLPLKIGERVVGVLNVAFEMPRHFSKADLRLLRLLSDQAALAIENSRLFEQTIIERRHIALLYDVSWAIASSLDPNEILARALDLTCKALGGDVGAAWRYFPDGKYLRLAAIYRQKTIPVTEIGYEENLKLDIDHGLIGWVAQKKKTVNVPDITDDDRWVDVPYLTETIRSVIAAPILEGDSLLGAITVTHTKRAAFADDHQDLLQTICQQVSLALSNARRYQDIDRLVNLLAAEQYRLEGLIETLPVGVLLLDQDHHLLIANSLGREILTALTPGESTGILKNLGPHPVSVLLARSDDPLPVEIVRQDPPRAIYEVQARVIGGDTQQWVLTLRDVTQEREIQERVQMQERLATVGQLAAGIAHDFNNIMAAIVVYADLLLLEPHLSVESQERISIIQQQVQRAASLIRQILDFSRRSVMEQSVLDLLPFAKEMEKLLKRTLPETIQIELLYTSKEFPISGDPTRLQQVFMNLAVNARDAMPDGGTLSFKLSTYEVKPGEEPPFPELLPGKWICIMVSDTGKGIPPENMSHIFEPFFTTKPIGQGTGLGLAQVYGIIKQHDGFITPQSSPGKGTTFHIYLPSLTTNNESTDNSATSPRLDGQGKTILLVEDDNATRVALQTLLKAYNYTVVATANGVEALDALDQIGTSVEMVVSDIVMPEMGGIDLYTILQARWPDIQMLFITGHPLDSGDQEMLEHGSVNWLQKPFTVEEFSQTVRAILNQ